jgi:hypothetical protein
MYAGVKVLHAAGDGLTDGRTDRWKGELTDGKTDRHDEARDCFSHFREGV